MDMPRNHPASREDHRVRAKLPAQDLDLLVLVLLVAIASLVPSIASGSNQSAGSAVLPLEVPSEWGFVVKSHCVSLEPHLVGKVQLLSETEQNIEYIYLIVEYRDNKDTVLTNVEYFAKLASPSVPVNPSVRPFFENLLERPIRNRDAVLISGTSLLVPATMPTRAIATAILTPNFAVSRGYSIDPIIFETPETVVIPHEDRRHLVDIAVTLNIDARGKVVGITLARESKDARAVPEWLKANMQNWVFVPRRVGGIPIAASLDLLVRFHPNGTVAPLLWPPAFRYFSGSFAVVDFYPTSAGTKEWRLNYGGYPALGRFPAHHVFESRNPSAEIQITNVIARQ